VQELTLVPRPAWPYEIWQAITSPPTLEHVPAKGYGGVFWLLNYQLLDRWWDRYAEIAAESCHEVLAPGERRMLVINVRVGDTHEQAIADVRPLHDEFWKFLGPYGWSRGYLGADGRPSAPGLIPTLEESLAQQTWVVGTADDVAEGIDAYRERLGLQHLTIFPSYPGDTYGVAEEQVERFARDVAPALGIHLTSAPAPA